METAVADDGAADGRLQEEGCHARGGGTKVVRRWLEEVGDKLQHVGEVANAKLQVAMSKVSLSKEKAKANLLDVSAPLRHNVLHNLKDVLKGSALGDPDMWHCVRNFLRAVLDQVWEDVEHEVETVLEVTLLKQGEHDETKVPHGGLLCGPCSRVRAFVLHHYLPHNRSIFGKFNDPVYIFMFVLTLLPVHGFRVVLFSILLFFLVFPGIPDTFQLLNFTLMFKGTQFLTSGVITSFLGAMQYFRCYSMHKDDLLTCINTTGPGSMNATGQLVDYLGSLALVWTAFLLLPCTRRHGREMRLRHEAAAAAAEATEIAQRRQRRFQQLLEYDVLCFALSAMALVALTLVTCRPDLTQGGLWLQLSQDPQFKSNIFWCRVLYSVLSLPFAVFTIPLFLQVLTHTTPTGYNEHGACVPFALPVVARNDAKPSKHRSWKEAASTGKSAARAAAKAAANIHDHAARAMSRTKGSTAVASATSQSGSESPGPALTLPGVPPLQEQDTRASGDSGPQRSQSTSGGSAPASLPKATVRAAAAVVPSIRLPASKGAAPVAVVAPPSPPPETVVAPAQPSCQNPPLGDCARSESASGSAQRAVLEGRGAAPGLGELMRGVAAAGVAARGADPSDGYQFGDLTRGLRGVAAAGSAARGADPSDGYQFGDFSRGLWTVAAQVTAQPPQTATDAVAPSTSSTTPRGVPFGQGGAPGVRPSSAVIGRRVAAQVGARPRAGTAAGSTAMTASGGGASAAGPVAGAATAVATEAAAVQGALSCGEGGRSPRRVSSTVGASTPGTPQFPAPAPAISVRPSRGTGINRSGRF